MKRPCRLYRSVRLVQVYQPFGRTGRTFCVYPQCWRERK